MARKRRVFWKPVVFPRPAGLACFLASVLLIVLSRLLADRVVMALGLALAGLLVGALVLLLLGWCVPIGRDGRMHTTGIRRLIRPRGLSRLARWQRLDQNGDVVEDFCDYPPARRGVWRRTGWRVGWIDPFGLWQAWRIVASPAERVITPDPSAARTAAAQSSVVGAIPDEQETGMIRAYSRGDALHLISWKQTARHDELMVRQKERRSRPQLLLAVDCAPVGRHSTAGRKSDAGAQTSPAETQSHSTETYDRLAALLYGLLRLARRRGWEVILTDGAHTWEDARQQDRFCAALYPAQDPRLQTGGAADSRQRKDDSGRRKNDSRRGEDDSRHGEEESGSRLLEAALSATRPLTTVYLLSPIQDSTVANAVSAALRQAGRTVIRCVPMEDSRGKHEAVTAGKVTTGEAASQQTTDPERDTSEHITGMGADGDDIPAIWNRRWVRLLRSALLPLACIAVLLALCAYGLACLFSTGLYLWAFITLMAMAVLTAWLPRPRRRHHSTLLCVAEIIVLLLVTFGFIAALASDAYRMGWVPFFSPELPRASTAAAARAGATASRQALRGSAAQGGNIFVGAPGSPSLALLFQSGVDDFYSSVLPMEATDAEQALLVAGFGIIACITRLLLIWRQTAPLIALLPLIPIAVDWQVQGMAAPAWVVVALLGAVVLLIWAPHAHRLALPLPAVVALAVVTASTLASPALSQGSERQLDLFGDGGSLFSSSSINPLVDLKRGLTRNSSTVAFTYGSDKPVRFRLATLANLSGSTWSFDQSLSQQAHLYAPSSSAAGRRSGGSGSGSGRTSWQQMMTYDYPSSVKQSYPRQSPFERSVQGLELLDKADDDSTGRQGGRWTVTADASARAQQRSERESLSRTLSYTSTVRIADLSTRFLPIAGLPQSVRGIGGQWEWNRDRVAFNAADSTTSSMRYTQRSLYLPAISADSQLASGQTLERMVALRESYRRRCQSVLTAIPDPAGVNGRDWVSWYRRVSAMNLTGSQMQAWNSCLIDFPSLGSGSSEQDGADRASEQYRFSSSLYSGIWALDDDPDAAYIPAGSRGAVKTGSDDQTDTAPRAYSAYDGYGQGIDVARAKELIGRQYRTLPARLPSEVTALVRRARRDGVKTSGATATDQIAAMAWLVRYFSDKSFVYSLDAPDGGGTDNMRMVARFLRQRRGYCVHYASALAVLGRAMGVPTRLVLGYSPASAVIQGGGDASSDGSTTYATAQNQLHSWVEAYIDGLGWIPFDVTPGYSDTGSASRRSSVSADEVRRAQERGNRQNGQSRSTGTQTDQQPAGTRGQDTRKKSRQDRTDSSRRAGTSSPQTPRQHNKKASPSSASPPVARHDDGRMRALAVSLGALLLVMLCLIGLFGPRLVRGARRRRVLRLLRRAGRDGTAGSGARAWAAAWKETVRTARRAGLAIAPTDGIADLAARIEGIVPAHAALVRRLARTEQTRLFGDDRSRAALRLTAEQAADMQGRFAEFFADLDLAARRRRGHKRRRPAKNGG